MASSTFVLDANVFIEAARRYYAFDLAPRFWDSLVDHARKGQVRSIDRVSLELERGKDKLAVWVKNHCSHAFDNTDDSDVIKTFGGIMRWVHFQKQYSSPAKKDFANGADGWIVAYAKVRGCTVVTHEVYAPDARRKVPIPNVCDAFDVPFVDTFEMLRKLRVRFE